MTVQKIYEDLRQCYLAADRRNIDKLKAFRSALERYLIPAAEGIVGKTPLTPCLEKLCKTKPVTREQITEFKNQVKKLNTYVHDDLQRIDDETLLSTFQALLKMLTILSGQAPDRLTLRAAHKGGSIALSGLNPKQSAAIQDSTHTVLVDAGPGTGKTHLLVRKMLYTLESDPGVHVVALSYTNSAARQLRDKFSEELVLSGKALMDYPNISTGTIHSYCYHLLQDFSRDRGLEFDYEILDADDTPEMAETIIEEANLPADLLSFVLECLNGRSIRGCPEEERVCEAVDNYKASHHIIHVNEILRLFHEAVREHGLDKWYCGRLDLLLVDECQDLSASIVRVISTLLKANPKARLFCVGDPRQNIFGFNGGSIYHLRKYLDDSRAGYSERMLTVSYRCPQSVIERINRLTFADCANSQLEYTGKPVRGHCSVKAYADEFEEAKAVVQRIAGQESFSDCVVLCSWLKYLEVVARELNKRGIPFAIKGGQRLLKAELKALNAAMKCVDDPSAKHFEMLFGRLSLPIDDSTVHAIETMLMTISKAYRSGAAVDEVIDKLDLFIELLGPEVKEVLPTYRSIAATSRNIKDFLYRINSGRSDESALFYESDFSVISTARPDPEKGAVTLSTIHSAKGLEWEAVYVVGLYEGMLPSYRSLNCLDALEHEKLITEEAKKFYVALTRTKRDLLLTYPKTVFFRGVCRVQQISRFLTQTAAT